MEPRISFLTLGVEDLGRSSQFYAAGLGFPQLKSPAAVSFFDLGPVRLALTGSSIERGPTGAGLPSRAHRPNGEDIGGISPTPTNFSGK